MNPKTRSFISRYTWLWLTIYFVVMTVIMTWPLALSMGNSVAGEIGDNIYFVWMIGWVKKALFDLHTNPFNVWFLNYPQGWNLAYTEITPVAILIALPVALLSNATLAYNFSLLMTFVLSGIFMYIWVNHLTGRRDAALIAGTIYAFLPFRMAHFLIGHLNLSGTQWFPLFFMGFYDLLKAKKFSWKPAIIGGLGLGLIGLSSVYYLYMCLFIAVFMAICYLLFIDRQQIKQRAFWQGFGAMALVALPLALLAVAPFFMLLGQGGLPDRNLGIVRLYSASPTDFILPSTMHFLLGKWVGATFNRDMWVEGTLYIGLVSGVLGILAWVKRKELEHRQLITLMLWGGLLAFVLALGTDFHWNGMPVELTLPAFLAEKLHRTTLPLALPSYVLFLYFPFFAKLRALIRFGVFVLVFSSAAAGLGSAWLLKKIQFKWQPWAVAGLLALVFLDFYPGTLKQVALVEPRPVDAWLAAQPGKGALIQFPFVQEEDQDQTYYTLFNGKPFVGGFFNAFPPAQYARIKPLMTNFPDQQSMDLMRELKVEFVLVDVRQYTDFDKLKADCLNLGLRYATQQGNELVFEMPQ